MVSLNSQTQPPWSLLLTAIFRFLLRLTAIPGKSPVGFAISDASSQIILSSVVRFEAPNVFVNNSFNYPHKIVIIYVAMSSSGYVMRKCEQRNVDIMCNCIQYSITPTLVEIKKIALIESQRAFSFHEMLQERKLFSVSSKYSFGHVIAI